MQEIWKPIKEYEGFYSVSNLGRVRSEKRISRANMHGGKKTLKEVMKNIRTGKRGYKYVNLYTGKHYKSFTIHRLLAIHFILNPENLPCVNHIDGDKLNNDLCNLEWCSYSKNNQHAIDTGLRDYKKISKRVAQMNLAGDIIKVHNSMMDAQRELGIGNTQISSCCRGRYGHKTAGGFRWCYINRGEHN